MATSTLTPSAELMRQIDYISEDETLRARLRRYVAKLAQQRTEKTASQARLEESLKQALREVKMEGEGKLTMQSWEEFEEELKREGYFD